MGVGNFLYKSQSIQYVQMGNNFFCEGVFLLHEGYTYDQSLTTINNEVSFDLISKPNKQ